MTERTKRRLRAVKREGGEVLFRRFAVMALRDFEYEAGDLLSSEAMGALRGFISEIDNFDFEEAGQ